MKAYTRAKFRSYSSAKRRGSTFAASTRSRSSSPPTAASAAGTCWVMAVTRYNGASRANDTVGLRSRSLSLDSGGRRAGRLRAPPGRARRRGDGATSPAQETAAREIGHEGARAEGPRLGLIAGDDLVDQGAELRRRDPDHVADLVGEPAARGP